jgi:transcriptional regulator with XRE-family HTH domain
MTVAEKFRYFRHVRGLTQKQLALALGMTVRSVKYIEAGKREPRITTQFKFRDLVERHERENAGRETSATAFNG